MIWDDLAPGEQVVAFDFETSGALPEYGLQPWRWAPGLQSDSSWLTSVSLIRFDGAALVKDGSTLYPSVEHLRTMLERIVANGWVVVGWNIVFDIAWLYAAGLGDLAGKIRWLDGMLLWRHLEIEPEYEFQTARHKRRSYALKPGGIDRWLPMMAGYADDVDFHATDDENLAKLQLYNDRDSVATWSIAWMIWQQLTPQQRKCALIEAECLPMLAEANCKGMPVDTLVCRELAEWLDGEAERHLAALAPHGVTEKIVRSPKQLATLLFETWGLTPLKETKAGAQSTDKETLHELAFVDERVKQVRAYREALNNKAKFATTVLESVDYNGDGCTHPSAIPFGTYSGRLTYASSQGKNKDKRQTGFALHQEKRDAIYRNILVAPPGYTLMEFDASGQEYRWMAVASGDTTMLQLCLPGEDPHSYMGARIGGADYHELMRLVAAEDKMAKNGRQLGKVGNLSLQYRTSAKKLRVVARVQYSLPMELPEAQRIHATYQRTYPGVPRYWDTQIALTKKLGYVETFAGRRVQVTGNWNGDWGWSMGSTAINYRIQGTGADQKYLAMAVLKPLLTQVGGRFAWDLHDGIYLYIPDAMVEFTAREAKRLLDNLPYQAAWGMTPPVPMPWDCKVGKSWGGLKNYDFN